MRCHTYNSAVTDNTALGHATQNNIQIVIQKLEVSLQGGQLNEELNKEFSNFLQLLKSDIHPNQTETNFHNTMTAHEQAGLNSPEDLQTHCFPKLGPVRDNWLRSVSRYDHDGCTAIKALDSESLKLLLAWLAQSKPDILLIGVKPELDDSSWTIHLLLETRRIFEIAYLGDERTSSAITTHLCPRSEVNQDYGPEIILQDLLLQIIEAHPKRFDESTVATIRDAAHEPDELWEMITRCIRQAQIRTLVILIYDIDQMFLESFKATRSDDFKFAQSLNECIRSLHKKNGITVKTMVTSRLPKATHCFKKIGAMHIAIRDPPYRRFRTDD
ncbi:hypothetical protein NUW58_g1664 [Xylaria curta]|uniref:Uncharacterized protein n=1 Tax=Xylaria curta TaxID=42375 RepID=A0ACC1PKT1_9PEZI|nr:hypothetical protein NUW58_g1664 [Xylaria curta]